MAKLTCYECDLCGERVIVNDPVQGAHSAEFSLGITTHGYSDLCRTCFLYLKQAVEDAEAALRSRRTEKR